MDHLNCQEKYLQTIHLSAKIVLLRVIFGGIIFASKDNVFTHRFGNIVFNKRNWMKNTSPIGAAVFMKPGIWDYTHEGFLPVPTFLHCTFESNSAIQSEPSYIKGINIRVTSLGFGALSATQFRVRFEGHALFRNHQGTALHASNNVLDFSKGSVEYYYFLL